MKPLISIIIPTFNRAHLIGETLDSILQQTYTNWECIVVDDGSTDLTDVLLDEYCKKDSRFQYHHRPLDRPKGANTCRNYGFQLSKGDYIKWFDSDDLFYENTVEQIINCFDKISVLNISSIKYITLDGCLIPKKHVYISNNIIEDYLIGKITYYTFIPTWKRSFLEQQKCLFDESITNLDDWDFNLRMLYQNPKICYIHKPLIKYRVHDNSLSSEINKLNIDEIKSEFKAREKHVKLLKINRKADYKILKKFIKDRYKYLLRETLLQNSHLKFYFFKNTITKQLELFDFLGIFKTIVGFIVYSLFKKGYRLLK